MKTWLDYVIDTAPTEMRARLRSANITPTDSLRWRWLLTIQADNYARVNALDNIEIDLKNQVLEAIRAVGVLLSNAVCTGRWDESAAKLTQSAVWSAAMSFGSAAWSTARSALSAESAARSAAWSAVSAAWSRYIDTLIMLSRDHPQPCDHDDYDRWQVTLAGVPRTDHRWMVYADWLREHGYDVVASWWSICNAQQC